MAKAGKKVIVILGGALINDAGVWRTANYDEGDNFGLSGDRLRVVAGDLLYKNQIGKLIVASGGKGQLKNVLPGKATLASVIKGELVKMGIPAKNIIKEEKSGSTYQQLREIQRIIKDKDFKNSIIISNKHHLPRIKAMIKYAPELSFLEKMYILSKLRISSAEDIVTKYEPKIWRQIIDDAGKSEAMKQRIKLEQQGVRDIKAGRYKF